MLNSKLIFIIAFIAVLAGLYGVADKLLTNPEPEVLVSTDDSALNTLTLWQLKAAMKEGSRLSFADLKRVQLNKDDALTIGVKADVELQIDPRTVLNSPVKAGQYLLPELLSNPGDPGYLNLITRDGMTLYPLSVATRNLIENYIIPGDHINILAVSSPLYNLANDNGNSNDFEGLQASLLMTKVRVISVGDSDTKNQGSSINPSMKSTNKDEIRIVIEVSPQDLARLTLAQRTMHLQIFHSSDDADGSSADVSDIIKNYTGIVELRGDSQNNVGGIF
ncbi:RcpC/CpaB family pilus assembly protein [Shewanella marinintestina]|uniref:RcpC/CpaB family pilus assembly protein n=1 Tax=Shewanella marinintestina TaxID=190305 RepID=UPI00200E6268|nr:RcpC/CpaB family pilus assembly protein [Shewanella marinintestina]MCL1145370.1 RcpC/CpaB family pilus assembly protein [Shewanella marinintestina]